MDNILVIDDDASILKVIKMRLEAEGFQVTTAAETVERPEARGANGRRGTRSGHRRLKLAKENGIELMERLHQIDPKLPVVILTAHGSIESAVEAMKKGAYSYVTKPFDNRELILQIRNGIEKASSPRKSNGSGTSSNSISSISTTSSGRATR